jgi:vancomycin permeability regulator SanA
MAVLGKQLGEQGQLSRDFVLRLDRVLALRSEQNRADVLVIGGGVSEMRSEAAAGADYLQQGGFDKQQIEKEELSLNTLENFRHARPWFSRHPRALVISNRYHLLRVTTMAQGLGLDIRPCAAEDRCQLRDKIPRLMLEAFFLHWYWSGRFFAELTNNRRMLEKIK